jgi:hypothetical protein
MSESILKTLSYFDIFNTPLTREEIYRWTWEYKNKNYADFISKLDELKERKIIGYKHGYYFLLAPSEPSEVGPGRAAIINKRQRNIPIIEEKMKIAKRACKKLRWIPFLEAVFVCNTVAGGGVKKASDIDVFIIIKKGRLWLSRFLTTLALSFFRLRRTKKNIANKICLSFYVTNDALDLSSVKITDPDIYLIYWIDNLIPIYDPKNYRKKIRHKNQWVKKYIPNALQDYETLRRWRVDNSKISILLRSFFEKMWQGGYGDLVEKQAKEIQKTKMKLNFMSAQNKNNSGVIINDSMLKFHENDRREEYRNLWLKKIDVSKIEN